MIVTPVLFVTVGLYIWWQQIPTEQELKEEAGITGKRELLVGVIGDIPGISSCDFKAGQCQGFDIDIAYLVAADLGFRNNEVRFVMVENEDRPKMRGRDGDRFVSVDLVIASYSITDDREKLSNVSFSAPYLRTEQSVITRRDHPKVDSLGDLEGKPVCTLTTSTSGEPAREARVRLTGKNRISDCIPGLLSGEYDAVTTDAAMLAGFVAMDPDHLIHHDIGLANEEQWGINTGGNEALRTLVNLSLCRSRYVPQDRRWEDAFDRYLSKEQPASPEQNVAVEDQPEVAKVPVRTWPWELPSACR